MHSAYSSGLFSQCMKLTGLFCLCNYIQIAYTRLQHCILHTHGFARICGEYPSG
jgi:hypothetical protein